MNTHDNERLTSRARACRRFVPILGLAIATTAAVAQPPARFDTPAQLANAVAARFANGTAESFDSIYPFDRGRGMLRFAIRRDLPRKADLARVVWQRGDSALLLLAGLVRFGNSGDEMLYSEAFSKLYSAARTANGWALTGILPLTQFTRIQVQALGVVVRPDTGLSIVDTLTIRSRDAWGLALRLNHTARITRVELDGRQVAYQFGSGILWVDTPRASRSKLVLHYDLPVRLDSANDANSGRFERFFGHVRNQYFWHPRIDANVPGADEMAFRITARTPAAYQVATDLPQNEKVSRGERIITAQTAARTSALSLFYDSDWRRESRMAGSTRFEFFATPDFTPGIDSVLRVVSFTTRVLTSAFGAPSIRYFAAVQGRAQTGEGWLYRSNNAAVAAAQGGTTSRAGASPRDFLGHEVSHGWTHPSGAAANFLSEGWATFAESILLRERYGADVERAFWQSQSKRYEDGKFEGNSSLVDDDSNAGVSYSKGAWVLRMLRDELGDAVFRRGMRSYIAIPAGQPASLEHFRRAMTRAAGRDIWPFLRPWLEEKQTPKITARFAGSTLTLVQEGVLFPLTVEIAVVTQSDTLRRRVRMGSREVSVDLGPTYRIRDVLIDPDHRLLLRR